MNHEEILRFPGMPLRPDHGPTELPNGKRQWRRNRVACDACHARRVRCDMIFSDPCTRCRKKGIDCSIQRRLRKRGRRGKLQQVNAKRAHDTATEQNIPDLQEELEQSASLKSAIDEAWSISSLGDTTVASDQFGQLNSPATSAIPVGEWVDLDMRGSCTRMKNSSDILEELGMGLTEDWDSTACLFDDIIDLNAEDDMEFPPLLEMWSADEMASDTTDRICSSISTIQEGASPSVLLSPTSSNIDSISDVECDDTLFRNLLNTYLLSEHLLMSWFPMMMS
ncbi:hypothetical protein N7450_000660 [Penicillium hetheringtonii]|uniref:Xylanolytic transcriptional activator xlnR n=1 Tax=Penicillium hetheringtonii TaxID=911720 RepID=A0AAD6E3Y5_9EURO|nr:hypothetical protein N7450_000660 [Penicillium hetheringtonii]